MNEEKDLKHNCGCGDDCGCHDEGCHDEDCGCEEVEMVYFEQEDGTEIGLPIVDEFEYKETMYAVVDDEENEVYYIFKFVETDGELILEQLEDELIDEVSEYYESLFDAEEEEKEEENK